MNDSPLERNSESNYPVFTEKSFTDKERGFQGCSDIMARGQYIFFYDGRFYPMIDALYFLGTPTRQYEMFLNELAHLLLKSGKSPAAVYDECAALNGNEKVKPLVSYDVRVALMETMKEISESEKLAREEQDITKGRIGIRGLATAALVGASIAAASLAILRHKSSTEQADIHSLPAIQKAAEAKSSKKVEPQPDERSIQENINKRVKKVGPEGGTEPQEDRINDRVKETPKKSSNKNIKKVKPKKSPKKKKIKRK